MGLKSGLPLSADYDFVAAHMYLESFEWAWGWAGDVAPVEVIHSIVAGAPNLVEIGAVLHGTAQVSAYGRECAIFSFSGHQQECGPGSESNDLGAVRFEILYFCGNDLIASKISHGRWNQVAKHGIDGGNDGGEQPSSQQHLNDVPPLRLNPCGFLSFHKGCKASSDSRKSILIAGPVADCDSHIAA